MAPKYQPGTAFQVGVQKHDAQLDRIRRKSLSPRQLTLNRWYAFYNCEQYESRNVTWDGRKAMSDVDRDTVAHTSVLPPGFFAPGGQFDDVPLALRKPTAPYQLVRVVVNKFSGLLFSAKMHPQIRVAGAPELQSWVEGLVKAAHIWIRWMYARSFGGSMGSVAVTFRYKDGRPVIEVHDSRWCTPTFIDRSTGEISALEIRYMYPSEVRDEKGVLHEQWFWYRRVIDQNLDTLYKPAPVQEGDEPQWDAIIANCVEHKLGEFPGVWVRNTQTDDVDGEPDCYGCFDTQEAIDQLLSQAHQGASENADPTLLLHSDELNVEQLKKGSRNAIKTEKGGAGSYLEMNGAGIRSALDVAQTERSNFLEVVQCVLDNDKTDGTMTATEVERRYSSMHDRGDQFREQYGEHGVKPIVAKMIRAAIRMRSSGPVDPVTGLMQVGIVKLPPLPGDSSGVVAERDLPLDLTTFTDDMLELVWPDWVKRGPSDAVQAANAIATARTARVVDQESSVQYLAPFFGIDDPAASLKRLQEEGGALDDDLMKTLIKAGQDPVKAIADAGGPPPGSGPVGQSPSKTPESSAPVTPDGAPPHHAAAQPPSPNAAIPSAAADNPLQR